MKQAIPNNIRIVEIRGYLVFSLVRWSKRSFNQSTKDCSFTVSNNLEQNSWYWEPIHEWREQKLEISLIKGHNNAYIFGNPDKSKQTHKKITEFQDMPL